jgi:signal transduction histidine kinase
MDETLGSAPATILVADDNAANLALTRDVLTAEGYRVLVALDGEAALRSVRAERPDLVLLDVHMPRTDGYEACRRIKEDPSLVDLPIIFLSGMDEVFNKLQAFRLGAVDYVVKPFQAAELVARVSTHIELGRARSRLRQYASRLESSLHELAETQRRLVDSEKRLALATLSSGLAHELNNPINYVAAGAQALAVDFGELLAVLGRPEAECLASAFDGTPRDELLEEIGELLKGIKLGAERSARIVKSLESYSSPERENEADADIAQLIDEAIALATERRPTGTRVERFYTARPSLPCYPRKLTRLFYALLDNAFAAAPEGVVRVVIELRNAEEGQTVSVTVADTGRGIAPEAVPRIFDPFFTTKEVGQGAGLGLSIALGIAIEHGGSLELIENSPAGTTFEVLLPAKRR